MEKIHFYHSPIGTLALGEEDGFLTRVSFQEEIKTPHIMENTPLLEEATKQLEEYFCANRNTFSLPLKPRGTEFQKKVWQALERIPYGVTASYGEIAKQIGNPKGARAVGMANNKNPIAIIIPCHRVVGSDGKLVGYGGGLDKKVFLLEMEEENKK
ncbi:methylated-DNA--[protein]-cysteine S-methyltransferase [Anaerotignum sp.]|uniref:methylated-DNA--[protein]-cysteine S-methyltransferase n=1 Tax=Anaerotignum sp. TaxID=2039241 RepID=UPI0027149B6B|nr:methylated-DNA--[protein]-cysteine S-methyltransferase [Anaerotignum sp.]